LENPEKAWQYLDFVRVLKESFRNPFTADSRECTRIKTISVHSRAIRGLLFLILSELKACGYC
jgi:hypothetical protein